MKIGVIADDFTGATDIAAFLVKNGLRTVQLSGEELDAAGLRRAGQSACDTGVEAVVVSLKNRSNPAPEAISKALRVLDGLMELGAEQIYFKYCSTFDSTPEGNIGPVTDALMDRLDVSMTVVCPALPVNGRTIYNGYLFVDGVPLNESGMRNHPLTPMTDASLVRLMENQSRGTAAVIGVDVVERGPATIQQRLAELESQSVRYAILDALSTDHLDTLGQALREMVLVTGGSGLGGGIAHAITGANSAATPPFERSAGSAVVISGSSSNMTNTQVDAYRRKAPHHRLRVDRVITDSETYLDELLDWYDQQTPGGLAPMIYATANATEVASIQREFGAAVAGTAIENFFGELAVRVVAAGARTLIVAGGETSGAVTSALGIDGFEVGAEIAPGVPLVRSLDRQVYLALKSGNFGAATFFFDAQGADPNA